MVQINPADNVLMGARQVTRVMYQQVQVWPPLRTFCDDFDRPNGRLGPNWMPGVIRRTGGYDECTTIAPYIVSHHVEGDEDISVTATLAAVDWEDDFERPDGPIGPNWVLSKVPDWHGGGMVPFTIEDGAAVGQLSMPDALSTTTAMYWHDPQGDVQSIEVHLEHVWDQPTGGYCQLFTNANAVNTECEWSEWDFNYDEATSRYYVRVFLDRFRPDGTHEGTTSKPDYFTAPTIPVRIRYESSRIEHTRRAYVNDVLIATRIDTDTKSGSFVGMGLEPVGAGHTSERIVFAANGPRPASDVHRLNDVMTTASYIGDQFVEITTDNVHQAGATVGGAFILYCQANTKNLCCTAVWCEYLINPDGTGELWSYVFQQDALGRVVRNPPGDGSIASGSLAGFAVPGDPVAKLRWEVSRDGHVRLLATDDQYRDEVVIDRTVPALTGDRVGFAFMWRSESCAPFNDQFDRPNGPIGGGWTLPPSNSYYEEVNYLPTISGGAAIGIEDSGGATGTHENAAARWYVGEPCSQYVEFCVKGVNYYWDGFPDAKQMFGWVYLFCQGDDTVQNEELLIHWDYYLNSGVYTHLYLESRSNLNDGSRSDPVCVYAEDPWPPYLDDPTVCVRFECDTNGDQRIYFDLGTAGATTLVAEGHSLSGHTGPYVGFRILWGRFADPPDNHGGGSPQVLWARGGGSGTDETTTRAGAGTTSATSYHILEVCGGLAEMPPATDLAPAVVFCVDTTGSMPDGTHLKEIMLATIDKLAVQYGARRISIGVIDYKDFQDSGGYIDGQAAPFKVISDLTSDPASYRAALDWFNDDTCYGGGDTPEAVFSALYAAAELNNWGAGRADVVIIGDAEPKDPEPYTGYTHNSTIGTLTEAGIRVSALIDDYGPTNPATLRLGAITADTGGVLMRYDLYDEGLIDAMAQAIVDAINLVR